MASHANSVYSVVDTRPSVESFRLYPGKGYPGLVPYDCTITCPHSNGLTLRLTLPNAGRGLTFQDFSVDGVQVSSKDCYWLRMVGNGQDPGMVGAESLPEEERGIRWFSRMVDCACVDIWRIMGTHILTKFGISSDTKYEKQGDGKTLDKKVALPKVLIQSGTADLKTNVIGGWTYSRTFFLHKIYSKCFVFQTAKTPASRTNIPLEGIVNPAAQSCFFRMKINLKCFEFVWHQLDNVIIIKTYPNVSEITWVDVPAINNNTSQEVEEEKKAIHAIEEDTALCAFVSKKLEKKVNKPKNSSKDGLGYEYSDDDEEDTHTILETQAEGEKKKKKKKGGIKRKEPEKVDDANYFA